VSAIGKWWPALAVALAVFAWRHHESDLRAEGALQERLAGLTRSVAARESVIAALAQQKARVDTVRVKSAASAFNSADRYQKLRDSLRAMTDTMPTIKPVLIAADSAVGVCSRALRDCGNAIRLRDVMLAHKDTLLWAKDSIIRVKDKQRPSWLTRTLTKAGWFAGGYVAGSLLHQ